jgi:hypothetical protein
LEKNAEQIRATIREKSALFREKLEEQYAFLFGDFCESRKLPLLATDADSPRL